MIKPSECSFTRPPMEIWLGSELMNELNMAHSILYQDLTEIPKLMENSDNKKILHPVFTDTNTIGPWDFLVFIYGVKIQSGTIDKKTRNWTKRFQKEILENLIENSECYDNHFFDIEINSLKKKFSYDSYAKLYNYYYRVENNRAAAFHWLKKLSYFNVPKDIRNLSNAYRNGRGCPVDVIQARKLSKKLKNTPY